MSKKMRVVAIADINVDLFVRTKLDQDRVIEFAAHMEEGVKFPPIGITKDNRLVFGRHRLEALKMLDRTETEAEIIEADDEVEIIKIAWDENAKSSLPPSREDTEHTIEMLLDRKLPKKQIGELLGLPPGLARTYLKNVQARITTKRLQTAATAIAKRDYTAARAAEEFGVDLDRLKDFISGFRRKTSEFADLKHRLIHKAKSHSATLTSLCQKLHIKYEDGELTKPQVDELFTLMLTQAKQVNRFVSDWQKRFESKATVSA